MYLVEYKLKNHKLFYAEWEQVREHYPKDCELIHLVVGVHGELAVSLWKAPSEKVLHDFHKKYFDKVSSWKICEVDKYHAEGFNYRKTA